VQLLLFATLYDALIAVLLLIRTELLILVEPDTIIELVTLDEAITLDENKTWLELMHIFVLLMLLQFYEFSTVPDNDMFVEL
jgi:hypothetical protein